MTQSELIKNLNEAQKLLSDVYHWADTVGVGQLKTNAHLASLMSCADDCIIEALDYLTGGDDE
jgi:hypothetical protein